MPHSRLKSSSLFSSSGSSAGGTCPERRRRVRNRARPLAVRPVSEMKEGEEPPGEPGVSESSPPSPLARGCRRLGDSALPEWAMGGAVWALCHGARQQCAEQPSALCDTGGGSTVHHAGR